MTMRTITSARKEFSPFPDPLPANSTGPAVHIQELFEQGPLPRFVSRGSLISLQGDTADTLYQILSGTVRCYLIDKSGQRRIVRFARPGDILGLSAVETWHLTKEAIDDVVLRAITRDMFETAFDRSPRLRREVRQLLLEEIEEREHLVNELAQFHAADRLLHFLTAFSDRAPRRDNWFILPMGRNDLADYLGLSFETVSRCFGALRDRGSIVMDGINRYRLCRQAG